MALHYTDGRLYGGNGDDSHTAYRPFAVQSVDHYTKDDVVEYAEPEKQYFFNSNRRACKNTEVYDEMVGYTNTGRISGYNGYIVGEGNSVGVGQGEFARFSYERTRPESSLSTNTKDYSALTPTATRSSIASGRGSSTSTRRGLSNRSTNVDAGGGGDGNEGRPATACGGSSCRRGGDRGGGEGDESDDSYRRDSGRSASATGHRPTPYQLFVYHQTDPRLSMKVERGRVTGYTGHTPGQARSVGVRTAKYLNDWVAATEEGGTPHPPWRDENPSYLR